MNDSFDVIPSGAALAAEVVGLDLAQAIPETSDTPHNGCEKFVERYGRDATVFVNTGEGKEYRLRGIYGRVVKDGAISVGDTVVKA